MKYNHYQYPASLKFAEIHRKASSFGLVEKIPIEEYQKSICHCCHTPFKVKRLSYWKASLSQIGKVSPRLQEYFQILLFLMTVFLILFILTGVFQIVYNPSIVHCNFFKCESAHKLKIQNYYSKLGDSSSFEVLSVELMMLISIVLIFIIKTLFFGYLLRQKRRNEGQFTIKHYSVHADNLKSRSADDIKKEVVREFNNRKYKIGVAKNLVLKEEDVIFVSRFRNLSNMHSLIKKFMNLSKKRKILRIKYKDRKKYDFKRKKKIYKHKPRTKGGSTQNINIEDLVGEIGVQKDFEIENQNENLAVNEEEKELLSISKIQNITINSDEASVYNQSMRREPEKTKNNYSPIDSLPTQKKHTIKKQSSKGILRKSKKSKKNSDPLITLNQGKMPSDNNIPKKERTRNVFKSNQSEQENGGEMTMAHQDSNLPENIKKPKDMIMSKMYDKKKRTWKRREKGETLMDKKYKEKDNKLEEEIRSVVKKITTLRTDKSKMLKEAIVTFNRVKHAKAMVSNYWKIISCEYFGNPAPFFKEANQPLDIIWENFSDSRSWRRTKIILFFFIAIGMIAFNCWVITTIKTRQKIFIETRQDPLNIIAPSLNNWVFWFNLLILISIITINFLLRKFMEFLSSFENRKFYTEFQISKILKISLLLFMNVAFVLLVTTIILSLQGQIEENFGELFGDEGVVFSMQMIMISSLTNPIIWSMFNPEHLIFHLHYLYARNKVLKNKKDNRYIQEELNLIFQRFDFEIDFKYYMILKTVSTAMFFQFIIPLGSVIAFIELALYFIFDKHILLARCERPKQMEFSLTLNVLKIFDKCLVLIPLGNLIFFRLYLNKQNNQIIFWISFVMTFIEAFLISWRRIFYCCQKSVGGLEESPDFLSVAHAVLKYTDINPAECHVNFSASVKSNRAISTQMSYMSIIPFSNNVSSVSRRNPSFKKFGTDKKISQPSLGNVSKMSNNMQDEETNDQMFLSLVNSVNPGIKMGFLTNRKKKTDHQHNQERIELITQYEEEIKKENPNSYRISRMSHNPSIAKVGVDLANDYSPKNMSKIYENKVLMMSNMKGINKNIRHIKQHNPGLYRTSINKISQFNSQVHNGSVRNSIYERQDNQNILMSVPKNTRVDGEKNHDEKFDFQRYLEENISRQESLMHERNNFTPKNKAKLEEVEENDIQDAETNVNTVREDKTAPFTFLPPKKTNFEFVNSDEESDNEIRETKENDSESKKNSRIKYVLGGISESQELRSSKGSEKQIEKQKTNRMVNFGDGKNYSIREISISKSINEERAPNFTESVFSLRASKPIRPMTRTITSQEQIKLPNKTVTPYQQTTSVGQLPDSHSSSFKKINTDFLSKDREQQRSSQDMNSSRKSFRDALEKIKLNKPDSDQNLNFVKKEHLSQNQNSENFLNVPIIEEPENENSRSNENSRNLEAEIEEFDGAQFGTFGKDGYEKQFQKMKQTPISSSFRPPEMQPKSEND